MRVSEYVQYDGVGLADLIRRGEVSAIEVANAALAACDALNPQINAVVESWPQDVPALVADIPDDAPLMGVPFLLKDVALTMKGKAVEFGSRLARGAVQHEDSWLMQRFRQAGLVAFGRTAIPEMAYSTTTESELNGPCRNPWNSDLSPAGSSGGAAAALAAGIAPLAHATDGLGSIRLPASWNGLVGLKTTRGRISNGPHQAEGLSGLGIQFGLSRTVRDTAALLDCCHGGTVGERYEIALPSRPYRQEVDREPGSLRIGVVNIGWGGTRAAASILDALDQVVQLCTDLGHTVEPITIDIGVSWDAFAQANARMWNANLVNWCQALANATGRPIDETTLEHATLLNYRHGLRVTAPEYLQAQDVENIVTRRIGSVFVEYDIILSPTSPRLPIKIGTYLDGKPVADALEWFDRLYKEAPFTPVFNVAGTPAISLPLESDGETGLPIGFQFAAGFGREDLLLRLAANLSDRGHGTRESQQSGPGISAELSARAETANVYPLCRSFAGALRVGNAPAANAARPVWIHG